MCNSWHNLKTIIPTEGKSEILLKALFLICSCKKRWIPLETHKTEVYFISFLSTSHGFCLQTQTSTLILHLFSCLGVCCHCSDTRSHLLSKLDMTSWLMPSSLFCLSSTWGYRWMNRFLFNRGAWSSVAARVLCFLLTHLNSQQSESVQSCESILSYHQVC